MAILEVVDLKKRFGNFTALNELNLKINKGEVYGFIGPNGAGKTTTIRILLGILQATEGKASIFGKDVWKDSVEIHKRIAYVPGDVNLWSNLTGGEVIDLFMSLHGSKNSAKREELLEKFDLDPSKKCRTYSKGNRQKIALVAALASDADLYILDEPTSGLDPLMEKTFQDCILELRQSGKSILLSSHILSEVEKLCDQIGIIRQGKIIETGSMESLRHLTRTNIYVETEQDLQGLENLKGLHGLQKKGKGSAFYADSQEIGTIITYLSGFNVKKLESAPPTLEDLFMSHYNDKGGE